MRFYLSSGAGGGVTSDDVTASRYDIPKSKKTIATDSNDEVMAGLLDEYDTPVEAPNSLDQENSRVQLTIPNRGLYTANSKLYASYDNVKTLIGLTPEKVAVGNTILGAEGAYKGLGNAGTADVLSGKTFSTAALSNATGTMPTQGGSTITPGTANKTAVAANRYVNGNVIVAGDADLKAANIKKGVKIFGVTGTFEGYVPTATDLYLRGNNIAGWTNTGDERDIKFESGGIHVIGNGSGGSRGMHITSGKTINLTPYSKLNVQVNYKLGLLSSGVSLDLILHASENPTSSFKEIASVTLGGFTGNVWKEVTGSIDITNDNYTRYLRLYFDPMATSASKGWVYRIWLS